MLIVRAVAVALDDLGVDAGQLLAFADIGPRELLDLAQRVPPADFSVLVRAAIEGTGDASLGLTLGARTPWQALSAISHRMVAAPTLRGACEMWGSYVPRLVGSSELVLREEGETALLGYSSGSEPGEVRRFAAEYTLSFALTLARALTADPHFRLCEVWFEHARPPHAERAQAWFGCPVHYERPLTGLAFSRDYLDRANPYADPLVVGALREAALQLVLDPRERGRLSERIQQALRFEQDLAHVDFERLARRWGMTHRTLRRRVRAEGKPLADLLDEARFREASKALRRSSESVKEIAVRLGYAETSSFHRAFKRWAGQTPSSFRKRPRDESPQLER